MKKTGFLFIAFILVVFVTLFSSCEEEAAPTQTTITYLASGGFGTNILALPDSTIVSTDTSYSFLASLEADATLKIKITNLSETDSVGHVALWFYGGTTYENWTISDYASSRQTFTAKPAESNNLSIYFQSYYLGGCCRIDFYENSESITKTKYILWE